MASSADGVLAEATSIACVVNAAAADARPGGCDGSSLATTSGKDSQNVCVSIIRREATGQGLCAPGRIQRRVKRRPFAVMPFTSLSPEADAEILAEGLTMELIHALTKVAGLRVLAHLPISQWHGEADDPREISRPSKARLVLGGSVRRSETRVRVTAHLINTHKGFYVWSESRDHEVPDLFALEELARRLVADLKTRFGERLVP
jgi:TolB-like protein